MIFTEKCEEFIPDFVKCCCDGQNRIPYIGKGILNIEAFYWWSLIALFQPNIILESGVSRGRSTEVIARAQKYYNIYKHYAFDPDNTHEQFVRQRLVPYQTIYSIEDSITGFEKVLKKNEGTVVVIIDGPKSSLGIKSIFKVLNKYNDRILAIGCHDCEPKSKVREAFSENVKRFIGNKELIFTEVNTNLDFLNVYILDDIKQLGQNKTQKLLQKSYFIGMAH